LDRELARTPTPAARAPSGGDVPWRAPKQDEARRGGGDSAASLLATHLERIATVLAPAADLKDAEHGSDGVRSETSEPRLAALLEAERGELLDAVLDEHDRARAAFEHALALDPSAGTVRDAYTRHLLRYGTRQLLVDSLRVEADGERDHHRAARLLYA